MNVLVALCLICAVAKCLGQGTMMRITFDGQPRGTGVYIQQYAESGILFTPLASSLGFGLNGGGVSFSPDNGTAYLQATLGDSLQFNFLDGSLFDLDSLDLAEYSTVFPNPITVHFVGYRPDGSTVTLDVTTDGIIDGTGPVVDFQKFNFLGFTGLSRVEIPTYGWSLDNVFVSRNIPEPSSTAVLLVGGLFLVARRWRHCKS